MAIVPDESEDQESNPECKDCPHAVEDYPDEDENPKAQDYQCCFPG